MGNQLLTECAQEERSLSRIAELITAISDASPPLKLKRAVLGDWKLVFASTEAAADSVTTGRGMGLFRVLEDVFVRIQPGSSWRVIEVARRVGPFSNEKRALAGRWSITKESSMLSFRYSWMEGPEGREEAPPSTNLFQERVVLASSDLLVLSLAGQSDAPFVDTPFLIFTSVPKLDTELDALGVAVEDKPQ